MFQLNYTPDNGTIWNDDLGLIAIAPKNLNKYEILKFITENPEMLDGLEFSIEDLDTITEEDDSENSDWWKEI